MKTKNLMILAAIVLVVAAYVFLFERHQPTSEEARKNAEKVFPEFDRDAVTAIRVEGSNGPVRLEKTGEVWRLREPIDFPAAAAAVSSALGSIANLTADRRLAADEADPVTYGLDQPTVTVRLTTSDGPELVLKIGDELPLGSKRALQAGDSGEIVIASGWFVNDLDRELDDWRSRDVVDILADQVASIDIESGPDHIRAVRVNDTWKLLLPLEDLADRDHLRSLVSDLDSLRIEEFLDDGVNPADLGLDAPEYEIMLVRSDGGDPLRLDLGATRTGDSGPEVACRRNGAEYFWVSDSVRIRLSKAPVLWRSKKVAPFDTWDVRGLSLSFGDASVALVQEKGLWTFADDGGEVNLVAVQERLSRLAGLEATDFDLIQPATPEMGRAELRFEAPDGEGEGSTLSLVFFRPLSEGGRAMVQAGNRDTVMGVALSDAESILANLEELRPQPEEEPAATED
ncbi:MAG: DUF4340 domain-containing protein [Thermoanaerobaculales bacterium]